MRKNLWKRVAAAAVCLTVLVVAQAAPFQAADDSYKDEINDLNGKISALKKEQAAIQADIDKAKNDKSKKEKEKKQLQNQVYLAQQEIELLTSRIGTLEGNIAQKESEIKDKQAQIDANYEQFKQRMRAMYLNDDSTVLGVVFGADSYSDFLTRTEMLQRTSAHDKKMIDELLEAKRAIEEALAEIQANKAQVEEDKSDMSAQKANLAVKVQEVAKQEMQLADLQKEFEAQKAQKQKEEKEAQAEIQRIYAENESIGDYVGGDFQWPVTGFRTITSRFGWRFGGSDYHTGIDIAGRNSSGSAIFQQPIRAANAGKVIYASNSYTPGRGYGRYVIIDHGGGMSTLYGHQNSVYVSVGDYVAQGETIGEVGTTGWSTGPHLHFEIRKNGTAVNPANYFNI
ncbi:peptidoglycan DD-metalloendopeptidase family protein [Hydrogenoanaerobacterium sp.]|uniref:murein hydrolase activator EnvC family protein n=1 Tax=Hydrogenoanaerobacterium sp. TaxID=2953763 RepID=UPI00289809D6|nr:peptidoglycan DD-metalloendopeptidase family protein [Hydrogenoanaerobacterium sp.]